MFLCPYIVCAIPTNIGSATPKISCAPLHNISCAPLQKLSCAPLQQISRAPLLKYRVRHSKHIVCATPSNSLLRIVSFGTPMKWERPIHRKMWEVQFAAGGRQNAQTFPLIDAGGRRPKANILGRCGGAEPPPQNRSSKNQTSFSVL